MAHTVYRSTYGPRFIPFTLFIIVALVVGWMLYSRHSRGGDDVQLDVPAQQSHQ